MAIDSSFSPKEKAFISQEPFGGGWGIRWSALTASERCVCAYLVLMPLWWMSGFHFLVLPGAFCILILYRWWQDRSFPLGRPNLMVACLLAFFAINYADTILIYFDAHPVVDELPSHLLHLQRSTSLIKTTLGLTLPGWVWYLRSQNIRVRPQVLLWACSIVVVEMLVAWGLAEFVLSGLLDNSMPTINGFLTGGPQGEEPNKTLILFDLREQRYVFFFGHHQNCIAFLGTTILLALDGRHRFWSLSLVGACLFLMSLTATRSAWLALPMALLVYILYRFANARGTWLLLAALAAASFLTLSLPPVTNYLAETVETTLQAVGDFRPGSTEDRLLVYRETFEGIGERPVFGHRIEGERVTHKASIYSWDNKGAPVGSHSYILGSLLYQQGIFGTLLFAGFWISLLLWLYRTRRERPKSWLAAMFYYNLLCFVTILQQTMMLGTLAYMMMRESKPSSVE